MRAERDKERKARQAELAGDPFNKEVRTRWRPLILSNLFLAPRH